ncbi:hypothetical protein Ocin01_09996 [Orchesella cincta]|uniref:Transmembrane protein n=1 Tax=Orchesella cincta TaxID=48709 RepID=A0A1D2MUU6_ORCCI|nr:hypothetical protein Ocin01_09996 [Orchesella cincta]
MACETCCCCCCTSPKGASFFCASLNVFLGMYLSVKWIVVTYLNGLNDEYFEDDRMRILYPLLLVYISIFLVLGCVNFIAVERESVGVLKWSMRAFILLQISMLLTNTLLGFVIPEHDYDPGVHRVWHIKFMVANIVGTSIYFWVVRKFIYSLENGIYVVHKKRKKVLSATRSTTDESGRHLQSRPSAPWSDSVDRLSPGNNNPRREEGPQTIPLKSSPEPQPGTSKN